MTEGSSNTATFANGVLSSPDESPKRSYRFEDSACAIVKAVASIATEMGSLGRAKLAYG